MLLYYITLSSSRENQRSAQEVAHTYCKNLQVIKTKHYTHAPRGIDW